MNLTMTRKTLPRRHKVTNHYGKNLGAFVTVLKIATQCHCEAICAEAVPSRHGDCFARGSALARNDIFIFWGEKAFMTTWW
jgi:hypothetical protein